MATPPEILRFYSEYDEAGRLEQEYFPLEKARTQEILSRHLPTPPAVVLDVGGGPGVYAAWLAGLGHEVHLVDPVPRHVQQAASMAAAAPGRPLASARVGDARSLPQADASADVVLLMGPLYHLLERPDRLAALGEARRVLRPGGLLAAAGISRYASLIDGLRGLAFTDPPFTEMVRRDLADGRHVNDTGRVEYFTTAYFHEPRELGEEIAAAGFALLDLLAVEGPGATMPGFRARFDDEAQRAVLLDLLRRVEREPSLLGASPHLLALARRP